ncbi:hypothetical protein WG908_03830 [Sphingobium sp. AN641]|uniref:hypothetical protein n=1 Tax=Sphingobium sp. AN641 TaxID=3133443 RepID=UPI0030BFC790
MQLQFLLDFDGVLFNSAFEAYSVANRCAEGRPGFRQDISYEEFLVYRAAVTDAWQYFRLYSEHHYIPPESLPTVSPTEEDWAFAHAFFDARKVMMQDPDWPKVMPPYDFFYLLKPILRAHPERFAILSTRNVQSIREAMAFHDADVLPIFGQEDIRRLGSKLAVAKEQAWLERGKWLVVYVDDMNSHLEPFEGQIHLPLHADWGYDKGTPGSLSANQIVNIISSLLALTEQDCP